MAKNLTENLAETAHKKRALGKVLGPDINEMGAMDHRIEEIAVDSHHHPISHQDTLQLVLQEPLPSGLNS